MDFWDRVRDLRIALSDGGEPSLSDLLGVAVAATAWRSGSTTKLSTCLQELRDCQGSLRLGLVPMIDGLLAELQIPDQASPLL